MAAQFFTSAFNRYTQNERNLENLDCQIRLLKQNKREQAKKRRTLAYVKQFIHRAKVFGLERNKWEHYDVNIEEMLYFHEARRILTQTANSESCYFNPISLEIKKLEKQAPQISGQEKTSADKGKDLQHGDVLLNLKGTFVVRKK